MYVPNYIPQPVEIPGNVTGEKWPVKLRFLRIVTAWHLGSVVVLVLTSLLPLPPVALVTTIVALFVALLLLCLVRILTRGTAWDLRVSVALLPAILVLIAVIAKTLLQRGFPAWTPLVGLGASAAYTSLCGRDFSFLGQFVLSLITSAVMVAVIAVIVGMNSKMAAWGMAANALFLTYYCYDLASLMSRRRLGEELAATVDLYRDVLNVFGWIVRCARHWRRHRIWVTPWS